jgi:type II secretory pathway predicted ATPase ExeA
MPLVEHFGLRRDPFLDTADPSFYFETMATANSRRRLVDCLGSGRGMAVILGPIGVGKTTLCNAAQAELLAESRFAVGLILDPSFTSEAECLATLAGSLGAAIDAALPVREIKERLKTHVFELAAAGRQPIVFVDEAQLLDERYFETLRSLLNYQLDERKLLSIALSGQMELQSMLARHPNFSDRIALWLELKPLSQSEAAGLIDHRLRCAGFGAPRSPFDEAAMIELWRHSAGYPRRLITVAREAMETASERGRIDVAAGDVRAAASRVAPATRLDHRVGPPDGDPAAGVAGPTSTRRSKPWWQFWGLAS